MIPLQLSALQQASTHQGAPAALQLLSYPLPHRKGGATHPLIHSSIPFFRQQPCVLSVPFHPSNTPETARLNSSSFLPSQQVHYTTVLPIPTTSHHHSLTHTPMLQRQHTIASPCIHVASSIARYTIGGILQGAAAGGWSGCVGPGVVRKITRGAIFRRI